MRTFLRTYIAVHNFVMYGAGMCRSVAAYFVAHICAILIAVTEI